MPAVMAGAGTSSILTLVAIADRCPAARRHVRAAHQAHPHHEGGLYAYARHEFGDFAGYLTAWCYWITCWAGNAAIVSSWVLYVEELFGIDNPSAWTNFGIALTGLWIPAAINLVGVRQMAFFQSVTVVLKFLPLLVVGTLGWFFVETGNFGPFNASGGSLYDAVNLAAGVALFSFIGVECAHRRRPGPGPTAQRRPGLGHRHRRQRPALRRRHRRGDGPRPHGQLVDDGAPFVAAFDAMFDGGWIGKLVALTAVISGIGALNGWTMVTAEMPYAAAKDGLFLHAFAKVSQPACPGSASSVRPPSPRAHGVELQR